MLVAGQDPSVIDLDPERSLAEQRQTIINQPLQPLGNLSSLENSRGSISAQKVPRVNNDVKAEIMKPVMEQT